VISLLASFGVPAQARDTGEPRKTPAELTIEALAHKQLEELGIPEDFLPFLRDDAKVRTGRALFGEAAPDLDGDSAPEVLETDLRYSYAARQGVQDSLPTVQSEVDTRIVVRQSTTGKKLWAKRYNRDAWAISMRVGEKGRQGVVVVSGLWNFYGTTETSTLGFDAFEGRSGKRLWSREYSSVTRYDLLTTVSEDAPLMIARFDALEGRAEDLMVAFATRVGDFFDTVMATRVVVIDGATGVEHQHPMVDVGVNWWPIPLPTKDLDKDGLEDYATTNNHGVDLGGSQEPPSFGGTVYARKGTDGSSIWTTSGIEMALFAFTIELPDVVSDGTPDVALNTYVEKNNSLLPAPIDVPLISFVRYEDRVYLFDGRFGTERWHRPREWIYSPGDIDSNGKDDLLMGKFKIQPKRSRTLFDQLAVDGDGHRLWGKVSVWEHEALPCPKGFCVAWYGYSVDVSPDVQPDRVKDVLFSQDVEQDASINDSVTRLFDGRSGDLGFETDDEVQSVGVAIDGRGTDLVSHRIKGNKVRVTAHDGSYESLWTGILGGPDKILPRQYWLWADGFVLPGDRCGDLVIDASQDNDSFYGVFNGADGQLMWWRWTGPKAERPTFTQRRDYNKAC
jgi:hypothetical protein